jgi:biopolymer transport protein ExbD
MRRKHKRLQSNAELDITTFMNLMIVLVPVLLINMVLSTTSILDLNFPEESLGGADPTLQLQLQVIILENQLVVSDNQGGVIKQVANVNNAHDFKLLGLVMQDIKARMPEKRDITIMPQPGTSYQTLVSVMDTVRSFKTVMAGSLVHAELFPEISIADAPEILLPEATANGDGS